MPGLRGGEEKAMKQDAKTYLKEIWGKQQQIERLKKRRAALHLDVSFGSIDYSADKVQNSPKNKLEEAAVKLYERIEKIDNTIARLSVEVDDRIGSIEALNNESHRDLLFKRYVEGKSFEKISVEMHYVYNYTCNLHGKALKELSEHLNFS